MPSVPRSQLLGYGVLAVLCLVLGGRWLVGHSAAPTGAGAGGGGGRPAVASRVSIQPAARSAVVDVTGAVRHPGVYRVSAGGRVQDAIRCAGGPTTHADLAAINLAAPVQDGAQVLVPARGAGVVGGAGVGGSAGAGAGGSAGVGGSAGAAASGPVSLGSATEQQLETLDGVGPATAQKIIAYRTAHGGFRSVDDLLQISGIGPKKLAAIKAQVTP